MLNHLEEDASLLNKMLKGEESAFQEIYLKYRKPLFIYGLSIVKNEDISIDLVHNAFVDLWQNRLHSIKDAKVKGYLYQIIKSRALNYIRDQQLKARNASHYYIEQEELPDDKLDRLQLKKELQSAISAIPSSASRKILEMRFFEEMSYKEISLAQSISVNTVGAHINRAIKTLRYQFKKKPLIN
ncbi:RNA polymerase sigma factor [Chitinophaga sp. 30R24]|uniref:RNA polymerase sigma factor n=1 Tax=Chitinophaga sp. 30R24 TaxID=3248838 RepID=UPI003B9147F8